MKFTALFTLFASLAVTCCANDAVVSRAIREATEHHERVVFNATIRGGQTLAKKRGTKTSPLAEEIGRISEIYKHALDILTTKHSMEREVALTALTRQMPAACQQPQANCNPSSKYRTQDGTCNNVQRPFWGAINQPLNRVAQAAYEDRADVPRGGRQQSRLPNPRVVSTTIHPDANVPHPSITNMVPQFGQFLDHDMSNTPEANRQCCSGQQDANCWPIFIPNNDPFYSRVSRPQTCMDFTRSTAYCFPTNSGVREQMNMLTAYIDGSQVYGPNQQRTQSLRQLSQGRLKTNAQLTGFLPTAASINPQAASMGTFFAGDDRINEMPALAVMHNLFLMEHNRIANQIRTLRPSFSDEIIFQETRRILGAELQQITYSEYLPIVLGPNTMNEYNLFLSGNQYSTYDPNTDATIINSFATAAYRFGHSLVNGLVRLVSQGRVIGSYLVRDNYGQSGQVTQDNGQGYDYILGGLMTQNSQQFDPFVTADMTNFLFKQPNNDFGSDLVARNIQRGRDHGLAPYNTYRSLCGLPAVTSWGARPADINPDAWSRLQSLYASPNDIDLFTGGLIEAPVAGGLSGSTFNCLKAVQFARTKFGDRYFFTHGGQAGSFTPAQLSNLRTRTLGDIICENSMQTDTPRNVFLVPGGGNAVVRCGDPSRSVLNVALFV